MNICGFSDALSVVGSEPRECPRCHTSSRIAHGLCLGCLLLAGEGEETELQPEDFDAALAAVPVADTHWRLGNYEILEEIGRGGMGVIYRARQRHSRRIVALKRVLSYHADSPETLRRFRREAEAAASLDHPNVLPIYEVGESHEGVPFFSMKYASGSSLQEVGAALRSEPRQIVALMAKVTQAVQYAHCQGILHRDLKPGNILLDGRREPLVCDFGLAKWLDAASDVTRTLTIFGTPGYIAPEQAAGKAADLKPTADIYSLGAILFDLLSGRPPFLGEHALAVIHQAAEMSAPKLSTLVPGADRDLETICARCLEREPAARYQSAGDLAEDLERWLAGRPIIARPVSPPVNAWRWVRRNPALAGAAAVALVLGSAVIFVQTERAQLARKVNQVALFRRSVAVVPFLDLDKAAPDFDIAKSWTASLQEDMAPLGPSRVQAFLEGGSLSLGLATPDDVRVASMSAATRTVLTGTVRHVDDMLNVSVRLIDAESGKVLLRRVFKTDVSGGPAERVSALAAREISAALDKDKWAQPVDRDPALQNKTANEYLRAGHEFEMRRGKIDLDRALTCYQKAIEAEPSSALARADYAMAAVVRFYYAESSPDLLQMAERHGREAIRLNPDLPEAHRALAGLLFAEGDLSGSREQSLEAIELSGPSQGPLLAVADTTRMLGRPDLSVEWMKIARLFQENPADYEAALAGVWAALDEDARAEEIYQRVSALHPDLPEGWMGICELRLLEGAFQDARIIYRDKLDAFAGFPAAKQMATQVEFFARNWTEAERLCRELAAVDPMGSMDYGMISFQSVLGRLRQVAGDADGAEKILQSCLASEMASHQRAPRNPEILYRLAAVEASLGKRELALKHLRSAFQFGRLSYRSLRLDPRFDAIRDDPRFGEVVRGMDSRVASLRTVAVNRNK
ncbi:MAG: protein kinase domain-containing protein [Chthoniobacterales bacterium]